MELTIFQENLKDTTKKILGKYNLYENQEYTFFITEEVKLETGDKKGILKLQLENCNEIIKKLKKLNWKMDHIYYGNKLNTNIYSEDRFEGIGDDELIQLKYESF